MECLLQYLDDLDDLYGALCLKTERIRQFLLLLFAHAALLACLATGAVLAFREPPLAAAMVTLLATLLLYRRATSAPRGRPRPQNEFA